MGVCRLWVVCVACSSALACSGGEFSGEVAADAAVGSGGGSGTGASTGTGGVTSTGGVSAAGGTSTAGNGGDEGDASPDGSGLTGAGGASGGGGTSTGGTNAAGSAGAGGGCTLRTWYPDDDEDGYGRNSGSVNDCDAPGDHFVERGGDCNDDAKLVFPGQTSYFVDPFVTSGGNPSFDYDCSGTEEGDPSQPGAAPNCSSVLLCEGEGFVGGNRSGAGINAICGSTALRGCEVDLVLVCKAVVSIVSDAKRCR